MVEVSAARRTIASAARDTIIRETLALTLPHAVGDGGGAALLGIISIGYGTLSRGVQIEALPKMCIPT